MKNLSILGSTGSIGCNVLKIVEMFPERFSVKTLAAKSNTKLLAKQIKQFNPELAVVFDKSFAQDLKSMLPLKTKVEIMYGEDGYLTAAAYSSSDMIVIAIVGAAGLMPTLSAIEAEKTVALANKESLVMAGEIITKRAEQKGVQIIPIDSEHSAIFQCFAGHRREDIDKIFLTASGGPFLNMPVDIFDTISVEDALKHPTWQMGQKISIDSATLMNKGLEVIEAKWLFDLPLEMIHILIHPQSIIHSMVSYVDGAVIAQCGMPDMLGAIGYAISYPERLPLKQPSLDFASIGALTFDNPDFDKFPCLSISYEACRSGGTLPAVLNAANEVAVHAFLKKQIQFVEISSIIKQTMDKHTSITNPAISDILHADNMARKQAQEILAKA